MNQQTEAVSKAFEKHLEESGFMAKLKAVSKEIEAKKMVPIGMVMKVMEEHGEYCERCEADDTSVFYDPTGATGPTLRCPWCDKSVKMETIIERARNLPHDYLERMIALSAKRTFIEQIGDDTWITDGCALAETAGDIRFSYPDREKFTKTDSISKLLGGLDIDLYEEAKISRIAYRSPFGRPIIAALKSKSHTVYINNDFAEHIYGVFIPYIVDPLKPVLIKAHGKICRLVLPLRFDPAEIEEENP